MNLNDVLTGIAARTAQATPVEPRSLRAPLEDGADGAFALRHLLREEFPSLHSGRDEIDDTALRQVDGLFAWLAQQLREFPGDAAASKQLLKKLLVLAPMLDNNAQLWDELAKAAPVAPPALIDSLEAILTEDKADYRAVLKRTRIGDAQTGVMLDGIERQDWKYLEAMMGRLRMELWSATKQHAAAALYRYDLSRLASILERETNLFEVLGFVFHAPPRDSLRLAVNSGNWTLKFWALHNSARHHPKEEAYPREWEGLLDQAAAVPAEWARWLAVLNEHPSRYEQLQKPLGNVLARASNEALDTYMASIWKVGDFGRAAVAAALTAFRLKASLTARKRLWTAGFERWKQWDFGCDEDHRRLLRVERSSFDFPVIGYLTECLDSEQRAAMVKSLRDRAEAVEAAWHADITPAMSERFKIISTYQLLAHAELVTTGETEWLAGEPLYRPVWEDGSAFRSLKYDLNMDKATF